MAANQTNQSFYGEVDKSRHRSSIGCGIFIVLIVLAALGLAAWYYFRHLS